MTLEKKKQNSMPIWKKTYNSLLIELEKFKCGERFHSLQEICDKYQVSKITARRVISELTTANLIRTAPRRGAFVIRNNKRIMLFLVHSANLSSDNAFFTLMTERCIKGMKEETSKLDIEIKVVSEEIIPHICKNPTNKQTGFLILERIDKKNLFFLDKNQYKYVYVRPPVAIKESINVNVDIYSGGFLAINYLAEMGHRRIAFLCNQPFSKYMLPRFLAYQKVLEKYNITFDWQLVKEPDNQPTTNIVSLPMQELLALKNPPTAIFTTTDYLAMKVFTFCHDNQIKIPGNLSICGYGNITESTLTEPSLTTIDTNLDRVGANAVQMLLQLLISGKNSNLKDRKVSPNLIKRESVRPNKATKIQ